MTKSIVTSSLLDTRSKYYFIVSDFLALVTVVSILSLVLETVPSLSDYGFYFALVEWLAVLVFSLEYVARVWVTKPARKYIFSFFGLIDIVSILPSIFGLGNLVFLKSARAIRVVRLLRMLRLAKLSRVRGKDVDQEMGVFGLSVFIYFSVLLFALLVMGTLIYLFETNNPAFVSIPAGMWWSLKVFLGSLPVAVPATAVGELVYTATRFVGLLLLGLLVGVVGNVFKQFLDSNKN